MVILIGGTGSVGKTYLSDRLMNKLGIPYVSIDYIMMGIYRSRKNCDFTPMSDDLMIAESMWPLVKEMINTNIENSYSVMFEGIQLRPEFINQFNEDYKKNIFSIFLCFSDSYIQNNYEDIVLKRSLVENRNDIDSAATMKRKNEAFIKVCETHSVEHYIIEKDYLNQIDLIEKRIVNEYYKNK